MNENCKYCNYVSKCISKCEYNSLLCKVNRSFPKIVDISYEELKKQNQKYKEVIDRLKEYIRNNTLGFDGTTGDIMINEKCLFDILKEVK